MKKIVLLVLILCAALTGSAAAQDLPTRDQLPPANWMQITTGNDTLCARGAPYSFYYREGAGQDLLINFQGGGMCWSAQTCNLSTTTFDNSINPGDPSDNPALFPVGITDFSNPENPFINYDMVYVNYCSGDLDMGAADQGFSFEGNWYDVKFRGTSNVANVLDWIYNNIPVPDSVFVTGCSAGSVGAAYWASNIASHYSGRRVTLLGDSGGGWRGIPGSTFDLWGTNYNGVTGANLSIPRFYIGAARAGARVAMYNTAHDETQSFFNYVGFSGVPYSDALQANQRDIARSAGNFRSFTAGGDLHCILPRAEFYTYSANGVRFVDWVAALAAGQGVNNVACTDCDTPEIYQP